MDGHDDTCANVEALERAISEAQAKADAGDRMFLVRAEYLRKKLASIPHTMRMSALNEAHTGAKPITKSEEKDAQKNLGGSTQVTVVSDTLSDNCPTMAGALPHAPSGPEPKQSSPPKDNRITLRMPEGMRPMLEAKAAAVKSYPSAYIIGLIAADLRIPIDEAALQRVRLLGDEIAALTLELTRQGTNFNQMTKATHEGKPCALATPQISELLRQNTTAVNAILRLGFSL